MFYFQTDKILQSKICVLLLAAFAWQMFAPMQTTAQKTRQLQREQSADDTKKETRTALVIGNSTYEKSPLTNPENDATDMVQALKGLDFEVISGVNQSRAEMVRMIRQFGERLKTRGGVGLFYYAGHGVQVEGRNYLIPVDAAIRSENEVELEAVDVSRVLIEMENADNALNIVVLDACRNNPFSRSWRSQNDGLAQINAPTGTLIAYSTAPGKVASDGAGRNAPYTAALLTALKTPDLSLSDVFMQVRADVQKATKRQQTPWEASSVIGRFYFKQSGGNTVATKKTETQTVTDAQIEQEYWDSIKTSQSAQGYKDYLKEYPNGRFAALARLKITQYEKIPPTKIDTNPANNAASKTTSNLAAGTIKKNTIGMELVYIPAGEFMMGSSEAEVDEALYEKEKTSAGSQREWFTPETPKHKVIIKSGFWMGKYEVTQGQWTAIMGDNPSKFADCGDSCPVEQVSWDDVQVFLKRLNEKNDGFVYSLPSEAEWEYAARAGTTTAFSFGNSLNSSQANFNGDYPYASTKGTTVGKTARVGSYQANNFGLYDMHGNVYEWVQDIYNSSYQKLPTNGLANTSVGNSNARVSRGGSWVNLAINLRSASRIMNAPASRYNDIGFRVVARLK